MKNLEQLMASFLCRKDFLDPEGTKSGGVPHIQLSESIKIRLFDDPYQLGMLYMWARVENKTIVKNIIERTQDELAQEFLSKNDEYGK
jgi:hypothetical protein